MSLVHDFGRKTNIDVVKSLVPLTGQRVIDAGCGSLIFSRLLSEHGAQVLAIDPDPVQAELNRRSGAIPGIEFVEAGADDLPAESESVDGVFFSYSLHHIPEDLYPQVFEEVRRVLRPDGYLLVIEPASCPLNDVMRLFHDEDRQRAAAWQALQELVVPTFTSSISATYHNFVEYDSFAAFVEHFASRSFNSLYSEADVRRPEVKEAFLRLGGRQHRFSSPKLLHFSQGLNC
jgi:ubiquinone/menaquinone biosynthesis C-methylase UbiE